MGVNSFCFDTLRTEERQIPENIFLFFVRTFVEGSFSSIPSFRRMGQIKKTGKCLDANSTFGLENNKPVKCLLVQTGTGSPSIELVPVKTLK